jgi:hypothetical protein
MKVALEGMCIATYHLMQQEEYEMHFCNNCDIRK